MDDAAADAEDEGAEEEEEGFDAADEEEAEVEDVDADGAFRFRNAESLAFFRDECASPLALLLDCRS